MASSPFEGKEAALKEQLKVTRSEDIGRVFIEVALEKCLGCADHDAIPHGKKSSKKRSTDGNVSLEAGAETSSAPERRIQQAINYITQSIEAITMDLTAAEVASAITTRLSDDSMKILGAFVNQVYTYIGLEGNQAEEKAKKTNASSYQTLVKLAGSLFNIFNSDWVGRGVSTTWTFVTSSLTKIFSGVQSVLMTIDRALNISALVKLAFRRIFDLLHAIASTISSGFRLIYEQAVEFVQHAYGVGKNILDRVADGENGLKAIFESGRMITDRLGSISMVLRAKTIMEENDLSASDATTETIPMAMRDVFNQILKLFPTIVGICDGYSADAIDASPEEKIEKESVVREFIEWLTFNPLFKSVIKYTKSAAAAIETGWKFVSGKLIGAIQKIVSVLAGSLYLSLFAFSTFVGNQAAVTFLSHMALASSQMSAAVANRRALTAIGMRYNEESMKAEEDSVLQAMGSVADSSSAPDGSDMMDLVVSAQSSFTYPSIIQTARKLVSVFRREMEDKTAASINKLADHLERVLDTKNMTSRYKELFNRSTPRSRLAMQKLLDTMSYTHSFTDADFRRALAELDTKETREAKDALRELNNILTEKLEDIKGAAMDLLRAMNQYERSPQVNNPAKKKKKSSRYEDARTTFDAKLKGTVDEELYDDPEADKGRFDLVFMKVREFTTTAILSVKGNFLMHISAIVFGFASCYFEIPGIAVTCALVIGSPYAFLGSHIAQNWIAPNITGLFYDEIQETSEELVQSIGVVKEAVKGTLDAFNGDVKNPCFSKTSVSLGFTKITTISLTETNTERTCVDRPIENLTGRLSAVKGIASVLAVSGPASIKNASALFLKEMGALDTNKEIGLTSASERYRQAASALALQDESYSLAFFSDFDKTMASINDPIQSYLTSLRAFYSENIGYEYYRMAAQHLRSNAASVFVDEVKTAFRRIVGEDAPEELESTDKENVAEELRVKKALLPTAMEQIGFLERLRASGFYSASIRGFNALQTTSRWTSLYLNLLLSGKTTISVFFIHYALSWLGRKIFKDFNETNIESAIREHKILNKLSVGGSQFAGKAIYFVLSAAGFAISTFLLSSWALLVNSMFYPATVSIIGNDIFRTIVTHSLVAISTKAIASTASKITGRYIKFDAWIDRNKEPSRIQ